jgi:dTDP-4-amino-4,6-dideoxygalactose transaminase
MHGIGDGARRARRSGGLVARGTGGVLMIPVMKPWLGEEEARAAADAVASGWVAQGPRVAEFEQRFAERVGAEHGVAVSSCTTALHLAMYLQGLGPGDEVVVPSFSFIATANCAVYLGATPVFADVEPEDGNLSVRTVEPVLTPRTRAVIVVHQGGMPADVDPLRRLCADRGITLVEDAACAAGSTYHGAPAGGAAELAAWSFHPRKLLTTGEGGMLTTHDAELAERAPSCGSPTATTCSARCTRRASVPASTAPCRSTSPRPWPLSAVGRASSRWRSGRPARSSHCRSSRVSRRSSSTGWQTCWRPC